MAKKRKRVYEYAKDLGISSGELMHKLKFMGIRVGNTFNAVDEKVIDEIKRQMGLHLFEDPEPVVPKKKPPEDLRTRGKEKVEEQKELLKKVAEGGKLPPAKPKPRPIVEEKPEQPPVQAETPSAPVPEPGKPQQPQKSAPASKPPANEDEQPKKSKVDDRKKPPRKTKPEDDEKGVKKGAKPRKDKAKDKDKAKPGSNKGDGKGGPSRRLEAIKKRGMQGDRKGQKTTFLKKRSKKDKQAAKEAAAEKALEPQVRKTLKVSGPMTVKEVSHELGIKSSEIILFLMKELNLMTTLNQSLDTGVVSLVAENFGCNIEEQKPELDVDGAEVPFQRESTPGEMFERPPVITVLGHVDHGKTRLLDTIRKTNVIDTESGGITQHIGAYQIEHNERKITFLDTPGHEAFTQLRARGAKVTDVAVLIVAADDGVMPQTLEALDHAREAKVPIIVAVNKIDKPQANPDRVRQQLSEKNLIPEEWGGDTVFVDISAKFNKNIEDLLEMIFLVVDMLELKAETSRKAIGTVIEAKLDKGKGPMATVLIQNGTLYVGDQIVVGQTYGKVRAMENDRGERLEAAGPSTPIEILGLNAVPESGDQLIVLEDEKTAKEIAEDRRGKMREKQLRYESRISLEDLFQKIQDEKLQEFKVILKADVQGSLEAINSALASIKHEKVRVNVIRAGVGEVNETDVMLAAASNAVILAYSVNELPAADQMAKDEKVEVRHYDIIYNLTDDVRRAMAGLLATEFEEIYVGRVEVRTLFSSSKLGTIAGSYVTDGEVHSTSVIKVLREGKEIFKGKLGSLKRFKDNVKMVKAGFECGIVVADFPNIKVGDELEAYKLVELKQDMV